MIIVDQEKNGMVNFEKIIGIQIDKCIPVKDGIEEYGLHAITESRVYLMAIYKSKERAKEYCKK